MQPPTIALSTCKANQAMGSPLTNSLNTISCSWSNMCTYYILHLQWLWKIYALIPQFANLYRVTKQVMTSSGANLTKDHIEKISLSAFFLMEAVKKSDREFHVTSQSRVHTVLDASADCNTSSTPTLSQGCTQQPNPHSLIPLRRAGKWCVAQAGLKEQWQKLQQRDTGWHMWHCRPRLWTSRCNISLVRTCVHICGFVEYSLTPLKLTDWTPYRSLLSLENWMQFYNESSLNTATCFCVLLYSFSHESSSPTTYHWQYWNLELLQKTCSSIPVLSACNELICDTVHDEKF